VIAYLELGTTCSSPSASSACPPRQLANFNGIGLAESALAAPQAGFGDVEALP
jgi:hypothetical protein